MEQLVLFGYLRKGFYVWKYDTYYSVGKNGTSLHIKIGKSKSAKIEIMDFINSNSKG